MNTYMRQCNLPHELRAEVRDFLNRVGKKMRERSLQREEADLLSDLSFGLRAKLARAINHYYLRKVPFFDNLKDEEFMSRLCMAMESFYASVGEDISLEGQWSDGLYFIVSGSIEVIKKEIVYIPRVKSDPFISDNDGDSDMKEVEQRITILSANDFWGEDAMLTERMSNSATARAMEFTEMRLLPRDAFFEAAQGSPKNKQRILQSPTQTNQRTLQSSNAHAKSGQRHDDEAPATASPQSTNPLASPQSTQRSTVSLTQKVTSLFTAAAASEAQPQPRQDRLRRASSLNSGSHRLMDNTAAMHRKAEHYQSTRQDQTTTAENELEGRPHQEEIEPITSRQAFLLEVRAICVEE